MFDSSEEHNTSFSLLLHLQQQQQETNEMMLELNTVTGIVTLPLAPCTIAKYIGQYKTDVQTFNSTATAV